VDSFRRKEIAHEVLLLCAIFIFVDATRFFLDVKSIAAFSLALRRTCDGLRRLLPVIGLSFVAVLMTIKTVYGTENMIFLNESISRSVAWIFLLRHNRLFSKNIKETGLNH
jgi:purine-cytosine permease-like protein